MNTFRIRSMLAFVFYFGGSCLYGTDSLMLVTEDRPPRQTMVDGVIVGTAVDKVKALLVKAGIDFKIQILPFTRAYLTAKVTPDTGIFSIARTPDREKDFVWIEPPLVETKWVLFALKDSKIKLTKLEDVGKMSIGTYLGDSRDTFLKGLHYNVDTAPDDLKNVRKLKDHKIDLWAADEGSALELLKREQDPSTIEEVLTFRTSKVYLALNPGTQPQILAKLKSAAAPTLKP